MDLSVDMVKLNIQVTTDKKTYAPGDTMHLTLQTTDAAGKPVDARLSVGLIDKALLDLYAHIKEPIPYFYNKVGTMVSTYTNLKFLYQMLRVFAANGSK
ncbi:MAG: hypothetical protein H6765_03810 [Candidatus Peribacteria bacterium]|nr:MAG: hypothetical protein H6765_03810 [Candidatus Peribacteria bacterium]